MPLASSLERQRPVDPDGIMDYWNEYLDLRCGTFEFRCRRYSAVHAVMADNGLGRYDTIVDVGAGRQEFKKFLRSTGWRGEYTPIDGSIDGTNLETWEPPEPRDWFVAIEVMEHLCDPWRLVHAMHAKSHRGIVVTTPNPLTVNVLAMDSTHVTPVYPIEFMDNGYGHSIRQLFNTRGDSILGWGIRRSDTEPF